VTVKSSEAKLAYAKQYREENREDALAYGAAYRASHREERAAYDASHKEERAAYDQARTADRRAFLERAKMGVGCMDCGSIEGLHFHHRDKATKKNNVSHMLTEPWCDIMTEIWKCDVLCNSCHRKRHRAEDKLLVA